MLEPQNPFLVVMKALLPGRSTANVMGLPPTYKLPAFFVQSLGQVAKSGIVGPKVVRRTELGDHALDIRSPARAEESPPFRSGEHRDEYVAIIDFAAIKSKDILRSGIPDQTGAIGGR